jgi:hypothetical protein
VKIIYRKTGELLAEGKRGWAITPFEGNFYVSRSALKTKGFKVNYVPGLCVYKFLYVWLDFQDKNGDIDKFLGWKYWLPNPLLPFIWFRVAVPRQHPELLVIEDEASGSDE